MTLKTTHVRGKGGYIAWVILNLAGVFVLGPCVGVVSFMAIGLIVVEKTPTGGFANFMMIYFSSNFHLSFFGV